MNRIKYCILQVYIANMHVDFIFIGNEPNLSPFFFFLFPWFVTILSLWSTNFLVLINCFISADTDGRSYSILIMCMKYPFPIPTSNTYTFAAFI